MGGNIGVTFEVGAKTMGTVASTFATVESRIKDLKGSAKELTTYQTKAAALTTAAARLQEKKSAYAANPTAALKKELDAAQKAFNSAEKSAAKYNITVANSAEVQAKTAAAIKKTEAALARQEKLQANQAKRRELHGRIVGTVATAMTVAAPVKLAMDYESAMADVKKVTNFDAPGFAAFSRDMLKLSTEIPMAADGLAQIAAAAGQAGIAEEELLRFTKDAAIMAVAFDISAEEAGSAMTGLRANFHLGQDEVVSLGDAFNQLANNMDATAGEIINYTNRVGTAKTFGFTGEQVGALGAAMVALKIPAEVGARATNSLFVKLNNAAGNTSKESQAAFKRLGLPAKQMSKMFKEDAQGALLVFLEAVKNSKDPMKDLTAILGEGFSDEIAKLVSGLDQYKKALGLIADESEYAGSMQEEYNIRSDTTKDSMELMVNAAKRLGITLGVTLLSPLKAVARATVSFLDTVTGFAAAYPTVTTVILAGGVALASLMVATLAGAYAVTILSDGWTVLKDVYAKLPSKTALVTKAQWLLNAALTANPVGIVVVAVAALGAGLYLLYQKSEAARKIMNRMWEAMKTIGRMVAPVLVFPLVVAWEMIKAVWEPAKEFFGFLWQDIKSGAVALWAEVQSAASVAWDMAQSAWNGAVAFFSGVWEMIKGPAITLWETIAAAAVWCIDFLRPVWEPVVEIFGTIWEGIKAPAVAVFDWIGVKFDWVAAKFEWLSNTWSRVKGWFSDDEDGVTVKSAEAQVAAAVASETVAAQPAVAAAGVPQQGGATFSTVGYQTARPVFQASPSATQPIAVKFDQASLPKFEQPAPQIQAPVTQQFSFTMNGMPDKEFADRVVDSIRSRSGSLENIIAKIVSNIMARQKRLAYDS